MGGAATAWGTTAEGGGRSCTVRGRGAPRQSGRVASVSRGVGWLLVAGGSSRVLLLNALRVASVIAKLVVGGFLATSLRAWPLTRKELGFGLLAVASDG